MIKKCLSILLAVLLLALPLGVSAFAFDGEGFTITPCEPFTDFSEGDGQYMWQNPQTGSNVLVKVDEKSSNIKTLSDAQIEALRDNLVNNYKKLFEEQVSSDVTVTPLSTEKVDLNGHTALKIAIKIIITLNGSTTEETQYMWIFSTKERAFYLYITDNTGEDYENGMKMISSFSTPDEPLTEKDTANNSTLLLVIRGAAVGAVLGALIVYFVKKRKKADNL